MALPVIRTKLKTASSKNQGLQDILKSCSRGMEILSVDKHTGGIHNTKITLKVDLGEGYPKEQRYQTRVHFYNRVAMVNAIPQGVSYPTVDIEETIEILNREYGCDFTEDDIYISGNGLLAKETSLGYYNKVVDSTCNCVLDHQGLGIYGQVYLLDHFTDPTNGQEITGVSSWLVDLLVNGTVYRKSVPGVEVDGTLFADVIASIMSDNNLYQQMSFSMASAGNPSTFIQNLTNDCGSFGISIIPVINGNQWGSLPLIGDMELCPYGETKLTCEGTTRAMVINNLHNQFGPVGTYEVVLNGSKVSMHTDQMAYVSDRNLYYLLDLIMYNNGLSGYLSTYRNSSNDSLPFFENLTEDCLHFQFNYKGGDPGFPEQNIFDIVLGTSVIEVPTVYAVPVLPILIPNG